MNEKERQELQNPDNWDWEKGGKRVGTRERRTVVSVAFAREDFDKVSRLAARIGMTVSAFIRHSTLEEAAEVEKALMVFAANGQNGFTTVRQPTPYRNPVFTPTIDSANAIRLHERYGVTEVPTAELVTVSTNR